MSYRASVSLFNLESKSEYLFTLPYWVKLTPSTHITPTASRTVGGRSLFQNRDSLEIPFFLTYRIFPRVRLQLRTEIGDS